jgi:hypothetical protein
MWWILKPARQAEERRRYDRHRIRALGQIATPQAQDCRACILHDISEDGIGVLLDCEVELPEEVMLIVPGEGLRATARRVWQDGSRAGFKFSD